MKFRDHFFSLTAEIIARLQAGETLTCWLAGEDSDFVRLNGNRVRQVGNVHQLELFIDLIQGQRHARAGCNITGKMDLDLKTVSELVETARAQCRIVEEDPYLLYATEINNTEDIVDGELAATSDMVGDLVKKGQGLDLVGFLASSTVYRGFANSLGQRNWYSRPSFVFDWSCYQHTDKAVKARYAGFEWDVDTLAAKMDSVGEQLTIVGRAPRTIKPGKYRVYLAPMAMTEIMEMMSWGGFSLKSHKTRQTPLIKLAEGKKVLNASLQLLENHTGALTPCFTDGGFIKPGQVSLITNGRYGGSLVAPRSSREYGVPVNSHSEFPQSLDLAPGEISQQALLDTLDTGIVIHNLWYCNFSDRNDCRITGMTRYCCYWVEQGEVKEPINAMRFDESIYEMFGENLVGFTKEREFIFDPSTYNQRSLASAYLPGALIEDFTFTL